MKCKENMKTRRGAVTLSYTFTKAIFLHLDVEPTQTIDVLGMSGCSTFVVCQEE